MHFLLRVGNVAPGVVVSVDVYTSQRSISIFYILGGGGAINEGKQSLLMKRGRSVKIAFVVPRYCITSTLPNEYTVSSQQIMLAAL